MNYVFFRLMETFGNFDDDSWHSSMDLVVDNSLAKIVTFEPFASPILGNLERRQKLNERNENLSRRGKIQFFLEYLNLYLIIIEMVVF